MLLCLFPGVLWLWHSLYSVSPHTVSSLNIYTFVCRGHSWRVRLAKQETLTPPGHLVSPLVCRGPWMPTVVLYGWCNRDGAPVLSYFILNYADLTTLFNVNVCNQRCRSSLPCRDMCLIYWIMLIIWSLRYNVCEYASKIRSVRTFVKIISIPDEDE